MVSHLKILTQPEKNALDTGLLVHFMNVYCFLKNSFSVVLVKINKKTGTGMGANMTHFKVPFQNFPGRNTETHEKLVTTGHLWATFFFIFCLKHNLILLY
jgi:hypothetical protein